MELVIKFRVWDLVEKRMLMPDQYGEIFFESTGARVVRMMEGDQNYRCNNLSATDKEQQEYLKSKNIEPRDEFILMQFTNLFDKNGCEICPFNDRNVEHLEIIGNIYQCPPLPPENISL